MNASTIFDRPIDKVKDFAITDFVIFPKLSHF